MSEHEWKPGAVVMWCPPMGIPQVLFRDGYNEEWITEDEGECFVGPDDSLRPLVVLDPESDDDAGRLIEVMKRRGWSGLNDDAVSDMRNVLADLANPTPEPLPEPTDPAVRVVDRMDCRWAEVDGLWHGLNQRAHDWSELVAKRGPLRIVTPDAPTPDADRPLKVGDRVKVADDGKNAYGDKLGCMAGREGRVADRTYFVDTPMGVRVEMVMIDIEAGPDANGGASRVCDVTRIPGGEA